MTVYNPCHYCTKREAGCHVWCEEGLKAEKERAEEKAKLNKIINAERIATGTIINLKQQVLKEKRRWRP